MCRALLFGPILRLIIEGYLELTVSCLISIQKLHVMNISDILDITFTVVSLTLCLILPIFTVVFIYRNEKKLEDPDFKKSYGEVYEGYRVDIWTTKWYLGYFFIRRLLFGLLCLYSMENPVFQI